MKINIGHVVEGDNFFGRVRELKRMTGIWRNKTASAFIPGPRRIGKTSLVKEFMRRNNEQYKFIYFDMEGRYSIVELCKDLIKKTQMSFPGVVKSKGTSAEKWNTTVQMISQLKIAGLIEIKTGKIEKTAKDAIDQMEDIFELLYQQNFIFTFDEFSDFLLNLKKKNIEEVKFFLEWMRRLRQEGKIRLIITGSVNIMSVIEEMNFPYLINDMTDIEILPLNREEIKTLLTELLEDNGMTLGEAVLGFAVDKLSDGIPFFIQLFADGLVHYTGGGKTIDDMKEMETLYARITGKQHKELMDLHSRLKNLLTKPEADAAFKILAHTCRQSMSFEDIFPFVSELLPGKPEVNRLLKRLVDECYLKKEAEAYGFVSPMLADWWKNQYDWER